MPMTPSARAHPGRKRPADDPCPPSAKGARSALRALSGRGCRHAPRARASRENRRAGHERADAVHHVHERPCGAIIHSAMRIAPRRAAAMPSRASLVAQRSRGPNPTDHCAAGGRGPARCALLVHINRGARPNRPARRAIAAFEGGQDAASRAAGAPVGARARSFAPRAAGLGQVNARRARGARARGGGGLLRPVL